MEDLILFHLGRMMADMPSEESDDDEDDDATTSVEHNSCTCPQCVMDRIIGCRRCCDEGLNSDDDDDDDDTKKNSNNNDDDDNGNDDDDDTPLDGSASPCAICMEPETRKRRFAHLPCCSGSRVNVNVTANNTNNNTASCSKLDDGKHETNELNTLATVDTSSTRFCHKCLVKYLIRCGWGVHRTPETNNNDNQTSTTSNDDNNYATNSKAEAQLAGECPRCKKLLVLEEFLPPEKKREDELKLEHEASRQLRQRRKKISYFNRTRAAIPSTEAIFWYIANRFHGDNDNRFGFPNSSSSSSTHYRIHLVTLTTCPNPYYIPEELLLDNYGSAERIRLLCQ